MTEVELKARVDDRDALIKNLNGWAEYRGFVSRDDNYWGMEGTLHKKIRIRREKYDDGKETVLLTYKRKEQRTENGTVIEVNDERECEITDALPLETFLKDNGFSIMVQKHKDVMDWTVGVEGSASVPDGLTATFELCHVPPLGDFLEIEILSPSDDPALVSSLKARLERYLQKCGIPKERIEPRYYSELLAKK